jgi:hypothetical protein
VYVCCYQEYLTRLQAQKSGSGAQAFDFLSESKKSSAGEIDSGFTSAQMQILDDTEEVSRACCCCCSCYRTLPCPVSLRYYETC